jgi:hypothetical protein
MVTVATLDGPRGRLRVGNVMLDWPPNYTHVRQEQVRELAGIVRGLDRGGLVAVCGDFTPDPTPTRSPCSPAAPPDAG